METTDGWRRDAGNIQAFEHYLVSQYKLSKRPMALAVARGYRTQEQFRKISCVRHLKMTESWYEKFKERHGIAPQRTSRRVRKLRQILPTNWAGVPLAIERVEEEEKEDFSLYLGQEKDRLSAEQKYELYQYKKLNPDASFSEMSAKFSKKFKVRVEILRSMLFIRLFTKIFGP